MKKSHRKIEADIAKKFLNELELINADSIPCDFYLNIRQHKGYSPSDITIFDKNFNNFFIFLHEDTDIKAIVKDLQAKTYSEMKKKYHRK